MYDVTKVDGCISKIGLRTHNNSVLTSITCRSIRTLSRAVERKYEIGPMSFIKLRRLDAAYLDLRHVEVDTTTVTQVAFSYGFMHFRKFAVEYR
ncbi:MAG: helix-turn-helix domain-containing protein [Arenicellales bacterium]